MCQDFDLTSFDTPLLSSLVALFEYHEVIMSADPENCISGLYGLPGKH